MASYLLLRNNKQSGPLSKEDIVEMGIKPYDLVWVEGRSAAWRYPGELPEFKDFAPMVEEQPFDRFFKKNQEEQRPQTVFEEKAVMIAEAPVIKQKAVSVIMPKQPAAIKKQDPEPEVIAKIDKEIPFATAKVDMETKYSTPLDEIKERYVRQYQDRKQKTAQKRWILKNVKRVAVFIFIIGAGVLIGFAIKPGRSEGKPLVSSSPLTTTIPDKAVVSTDSNSSPINQLPAEQDQRKTAVADPAINNADQQISREVKKQPESIPVEKAEPIVPINGERTKVARNNANDEPTVSAADLSAAVTVKANNYKLRDFGGFET